MGDKKQSIYRFRGADPDVFRELRQEIPAAGRLPLSLNFRSQPAVLEFINALFADELAGRESSTSRCEAFRQQVGPRPAVEFLWAIEPEEGGVRRRRKRMAPPRERCDLATPAERLRRREADLIARRLRGMLDSGEKIVWEKRAASSEAARRRRAPATSPSCSAP